MVEKKSCIGPSEAHKCEVKRFPVFTFIFKRNKAVKHFANKLTLLYTALCMHTLGVITRLL